MRLLPCAAVPRLFAALTIASSAFGCRQSATNLGGTPDEVTRNGDALFAAFAYRFANVQRDPKFAHARPLMGKYALTPSKLYSDTSIWTVRHDADSTREIFLAASYNDGQYLFQARQNAPYPMRLGDERHFMQLKRLADDDFEWYTIVDHAIGPVHASQAGAAIGAAFTSFDGRSGDQARAESRAIFPRAARHLGQLLRIDSFVTTFQPDGSTAARMSVQIQPDSIRPRYPNYAAYLDKYLVPSDFRIQLTDAHGIVYFDLDGREGHVSAQLRAKNGSMVSLDGPPRAMPDSLHMLIDFSAKFKMFRVGFSGLVADFAIERSEHERAFQWRFRREPEWRLPLFVDKLIKVPLRRPFSGRGAELRLGVRDDLGPTTMSYRYGRIAVHESAIMRFLGGLGATAFGDFAEKSEVEENRFLSELFTAMRQDIAVLK